MRADGCVLAARTANGLLLFQGLGTDEETLIEIVCSRNNEEMVEIKKVYRERKALALVPPGRSTGDSRLVHGSVWANLGCLQCLRRSWTKTSQETRLETLANCC